MSTMYLQRLYPEQWSQEVEFTFTVPNLYGPRVVARFRDFISDAGFGGGLHHVSLVSLTESQAAIVDASHCLAIFKNNDLVLVCDAGGGTTYCGLLRIVHEEGGRLQMEEVGPAFGIRIGSTDIDDAMKDLYLSRLRENAWDKPFTWPDYRDSQQIEDYKVSFTTSTKVPLLLRLRDSPEVQVSSQKVRRIFDTPITGIFECVDAEMRSFSAAGMLEADNLVKYHVAASSSPADLILEVLFRGKSAEHRVERRVLWHDVSQPAPATLTLDVASLSLAGK